MLKFNEQEYRTSMKLICSARGEAEDVANELCENGFIFHSCWWKFGSYDGHT